MIQEKFNSMPLEALTSLSNIAFSRENPVWYFLRSRSLPFLHPASSPGKLLDWFLISGKSPNNHPREK